MEPLSIVAISLSKRIAILTDNTVVPITDLYDIEGELTFDPDRAITFVAGCNDRALWFSDVIREFETGLVSANYVSFDGDLSLYDALVVTCDSNSASVSDDSNTKEKE